MRKISRKGLKKKCDRLFSLKVREKGYCELEDKDFVKCSRVLQCAHIDTRGKHAIRWNPMNALCICSGHHVYYTNHPKEWDKMIKFYFRDKWLFVEEHSNDLWDRDLDKVLESLK